MAVLITQLFGQISKISKVNDKDDDKFNFDSITNRDGLIIIYESEKQYPGKKFMYFFTDQTQQNRTYIKTSCGDLAENKHGYTLTTQNHKYEIKETTNMSKEQKNKTQIIATRYTRKKETI